MDDGHCQESTEGRVAAGRVLERGVVIREDGRHAGCDWRNLLELLLDELAVLPLDLPMPRDERALRAARHVRETLDGAHTLAGLAKQAGASARTLERLFRAETGLSFGAWRQRARLLRALQLLADDVSVTRTAMSVGYDSMSAFVAAFRRTIGTTPGRSSIGSRK
jgi:transcriptional regulator GlxA family with amidase domain